MTTNSTRHTSPNKFRTLEKKLRIATPHYTLWIYAQLSNKYASASRSRVTLPRQLSICLRHLVCGNIHTTKTAQARSQLPKQGNESVDRTLPAFHALWKAVNQLLPRQPSICLRHLACGNINTTKTAQARSRKQSNESVDRTLRNFHARWKAVNQLTLQQFYEALYPQSLPTHQTDNSYERAETQPRAGSEGKKN